MGRIHLFEFEDQRWFPGFLRDYLTDFLQFLSNRTQMYKGIVPVLEQTLKQCNTNQIIDLGSGGGGGLLWLNTALLNDIPDLKILLTDYYPNLDAFNYTHRQANNIDFHSSPVNALSVPQELKGLRTMFLSFHHFKPDQARQILQDAVDSGNPIAIIEGQERNLPSIIAMCLSPLSVALTTPFIRPFKFGRILFTYFIPLVPLFVLWDGIISALRTYSIKEMELLVQQLNNHKSYDWEIGRKKSGPATLLYLIGVPKNP